MMDIKSLDIKELARTLTCVTIFTGMAVVVAGASFISRKVFGD